MQIIEETAYRFRIEQQGPMRVPGIVFASKSLLPDEHGDMALQQVANVATLPGIVRASYAMPDVHWGYGFRSGGWRRPTSTQAGSSPPAGSASTSRVGCGCW